MTETRKIHLTFFVMILCYLGGSYLFAWISTVWSLPVILQLIIGELLIALVVSGYFRVTHRKPERMIPHARLDGWTIVLLVLLTFAIDPVVSFVNLLSQLFVENAVSGLLVETMGIPLVLNLLIQAVIPAVTEEFAFRGIFYQGYRRHGMWKAMLLSAFLFGLMHLNFNQFSYAFVLGLLFPVVIEATGSIYASMLIHFLINGMSVMMQSAMQSYYTEEELTLLLQTAQQLDAGSGMTWLTIAVNGLIAAVCICIVLLLIYVIARRNHREGYLRWALSNGDAEIRKHEKTGRLLDPVLFLGIAVCLGYMIWG